MDHLKARICMSCSGVQVCSISVGMFRTATLGVDPFQSLMSGLNICIPISFGMLYVIANAILLLFSMLLDRHKIGIATLINLTLVGVHSGICAEHFNRAAAGYGLGGPTAPVGLGSGGHVLWIRAVF